MVTGGMVLLSASLTIIGPEIDDLWLVVLILVVTSGLLVGGLLLHPHYTAYRASRPILANLMLAVGATLIALVVTGTLQDSTIGLILIALAAVGGICLIVFGEALAP